MNEYFLHSASIAEALGLRRSGRECRGDCPACGYRGSFSLTEKNGILLWYCASCQDQAALTAAVRAVAGLGGEFNHTHHSGPASPRSDEADATRRALEIWHQSVPVPGTLADRYLNSRGLAGVTSAALRFHPGVRHPEVHGTFPALVALVTSTWTGSPVAIHRTYLRADGTGKADVTPARASKGPIRAGAILLCNAVPGVPLVIGEGIESSLAAGLIIGAPAWSGVSAGNLAALIPPPEPSEIVIAVDADEVGLREARVAAERWQALRRQVRFAVPDGSHRDFNDILREGVRGEARHG